MSTERGRSMLIQRRPGASTISTRGSSESGVASTTARERRPNGLRGRLGMPETERLVGRRHKAPNSIGRGQVFATLPDYIAGRIQRGGGTGPMKPRQPGPVASPGQGGNSNRLQDEWPGRCGAGFPRFLPSLPSPHHRAEELNQMPADALKCKECSTTYPLEARFVCERCFGPLEVAYSRPEATPDELRRRIQAGPHTLWRYADFLPVDVARSALPTGWTPLVKADRLARALGLGELYIKNETANPTHSFKDRVVSVALARAQELGFDTIACASTGNLANAVAAHAAAAGLPAYVLIPHDLEEQKVLATGAYGAQIVAVRGTYDDVNRLCTELSGERPGWAFVNINMRPYYAEGSKTLAFETVEQLGWELPDRVVGPIASGSQFTKIARGFQEFIDAGLVE